MPEEEENEKRNRARELVRSINNNSLKVKQNNNYDNSITDEEERRNRAREIVRSINSSKKANTDINTEIEKTNIETKEPNKAIKELPRFKRENNQTVDIKVDNKQKEITVENNTNKAEFNTQDKQNINKTDINTNKNTNIPKVVQQPIKETQQTKVQNLNNTNITTNTRLATSEEAANTRPLNMVAYNVANKGNVGRYVVEKIKAGVVGFFDNFKQLYITDMQKNNERAKELNKSLGQDTSKIDKANENLQKISNNSDYMAIQMGLSLGEQERPEGVQLLGNAAASVGNQLPSLAVSVFNPSLGLAIMGASAAGGSMKEAIDEGATPKKAQTAGTLKGLVEIGTEKLFGGIPFFGKGTIDDIFERKVIDKVSSKIGQTIAKQAYDFGGEVLEEHISNFAGYAIDNKLLGKELPNIQEVLNDASETTKVTLLSTLMLKAIGLPINATNMSKEMQLSAEEAQQTKEILNAFDSAMKGNYYMTTFENGEITQLKGVPGTELELTNKSLQVAPVVILNDDHYSVIDKHTGLMLDNISYDTEELAVSNFSRKINSLDDLSIREINNKIANAKIIVDNKMLEVEDNIANQEETNTAQTNIVDDTANLSNETTSNIDDNEEMLRNENKNNYNNAKVFREGLEKFKSRNYASHDNIVVLEETPQWLYNKGFEYEQPIVLNMNKLETIMKEPKGTINGKNQHGITMDLIEQLPEAIRNPLNVIKKPKYNNKFVVVTELTDQYGDIVVVPIEMNTQGYIEGIETNVNKIASIYGKEFYDLVKNDKIDSYMEQNKNNIVYDIDTYHKSNTSRNSRLQLPLTPKSVTSNTSITQDNKAVNNNSKHNTTKSDIKAQQDMVSTKKTNKKDLNLPKQNITQNNKTQHIEDFGKKIGGARKDLSIKRNSESSKTVIHDYTVKSTDNGFNVEFKNKVIKEGFKTQQEAEKYILDFKENIKNNQAFVKEFTNRDNKTVYEVCIRNSRTLKTQYTNKSFTNKQDAENYAVALSMYLKEYGKNLHRPSIQKVERVNPKTENATKATGNDILSNFGFKGGEFGNWVKQGERQQFLNYAQDAFTDLAIALDIDEKTLGQNNQMSIAFGARGRGLTSAVAHFEPSKQVINMTRLYGAGSLAHEYGHSIDNYLSRMSGYSDSGMATSNVRNPKLSDNMQKAINGVIEAMNYNVSTDQEEITKKNNIYEKNRKESIEYSLKYIDKVFEGQATKYKRVKGEYKNVAIEVTEEQKKEYKQIRSILMEGKVTGEIDYNVVNLRTLKTEKIYPKPINRLQELYKEVVGRKLDEDTLYSIYKRGKPATQVTQVKTESAYKKSSIELDRATGRASRYYSRTEEMWARAFESYVFDKLKAKGISNTYLVHSVNNDQYALFNPFPAGEERNNINNAFDKLILTMKEEGFFTQRNQDNTQEKDTNNKFYYHDLRKINNITKELSQYLPQQELSNKSGEKTLSVNTNITQNDTNVNGIHNTNNDNYMQKLENNSKNSSKTNAEGTDRYIEQEIQKIETTQAWDESIPVTKRSDIKKVIEDYLGTSIKKGRFREQAYGIYKTNRDVIRVKEFKDIDNVLHELGHALDLGKRIDINKSEIHSELIKAIDKLGGYENEDTSVRLDEGFAEVMREYSIVPEQAKAKYPKTVAVLEGIRRSNKEFDNFIGKVQQMTYNYIHQNPRNRVLGNQSIGEQTDKTQLSKEWIEVEVMRNIYDKDYALKKAVSDLEKAKGKKVVDLKASNNAYLLTRLASSIGDKTVSMLANGYIDESGNKLMPGLNQIGEILGNNPERYNDLRTYLAAQRDADYKSKELKTGIRTNDARAVVEQFKNDKQIQEASKLVYDTLDGVMQYTVNNGLVSQETVNELKESNAFYVPMHRVLDNRGSQVGKRGAVADAIKARKGSELDIKDILENVIVNSANVIQQVENNNILKALYKQGEEIGKTGTIYDVISTPLTKVGTAQLETWKSELKKQGVDIDNIDFDKTIDIFAPNNKTDTKNLITSFINDDGKRVYLQFNDELIFNTITNTDTKFMSKVLQISSKLNMPLRYGATMANIGFTIPNMISDTAQAAVFSTAGFIPVVDNALGVLDILTATCKPVEKFMKNYAPTYADRINTMYTLYEQSGALNSTRLSQFRDSSQNVMADVFGANNKTLGINDKFKPLKRLLDLMTFLPEISEQSTRFKVFEKNYKYYKNKGTAEMDARIMAALEARDATQDFGRTGNVTREINQLIPFSSARVGSIYTFFEKIKANPKKVAMRMAIITALGMAIKGLGYKDKEIEELNQRKKDDNFVFKLGDKIVTMKKPQGILRSMLNLAEYIQDLSTGHIDEGKEGKRLAEWLNNAIMDNMPADRIEGLVPNAVAPLIENAINKDFYYNTDIVKSYDLDLPNSEQYYDYNSQLAILLGRIFNYSPAKIDNLISGYFGGLGTQITTETDKALGKIGVIPEKPNMGAEADAIGKRFIVNVNSNSASIDEIYEKKSELTKKKNGGTITEQEEKELKTITSAATNISKINKQIREIKADLTMSGDEKAEKIRTLQSEKTDIARQALNKDLINKSNKSKIELTNWYPTSSTLSLNNNKLTLTDNMKQEYAKVANEQYQKYAKQGLYDEEYLKKLEDKCKEYAKKYIMQKYKDKLVKSK